MAYTLDQLVVFVTVARNGGFSAAARQLGRAQSAVTYAIRALEEESGLLLFDRTGYRAVLTAQGRALLPRAQRLVADAEDFDRLAQGFAQGLEAGLTVAVEPFVPLAVIGRALRQLHAAHSSVRIRVVIEERARALELMDAGKIQLGVLIQVAAMTNEYEVAHCTEHDLVAVAAPTHPLARMGGVISSDELRSHLQLVWTPLSAALDSPDLGVYATDRWYVTDIHAKRELLSAGAGWGSLPDHIAAPDLAAGRLVPLTLESWEGADRMPQFRTVVVRRRNTIVGPAARLLFETLRSAPRSTTG
ncbi:MAG TPA: LysR family transcriptional regulator [Burkholderiaceae bacterium]|nr:LysR family transcriptional regulator [Burkholderiaceae bacterium]